MERTKAKQRVKTAITVAFWVGVAYLLQLLVNMGLVEWIRFLFGRT